MKTHYCNALSNTVYPVGSHLHFLVVELSSVVSSEQGSDRHVDGEGGEGGRTSRIVTYSAK